MSDKIKEMMSECGWIALDKNNFSVGYFSGKGIEKYTELIAKECIRIILKEHDEGQDRHGDYQLGLIEAYREIKEH